MSKADSMLSILWLLRTGKRMTAKQLADELEIHVRTVYRYIDALCASGVPILADAGHNGGYSLPDNFADAPLFFNLDEQKALIHAAVFAKEAGYPFDEALDNAISKLKLYTNEEQLQRIQSHERGFDVIQSPANSSSKLILQELQIAVGDGHTLSMTYQKGNDKAPSQRLLNPYGLVFWKNRWYVVGYCHLRSEIRSFRVDRIQSVSRSPHRFQPPKDFSAGQFFLQKVLPDAERNELIAVRIQGKPQALQGLCEHWLFGRMLVERSEDEALFQLDEQAIRVYAPYFLLPYGRAIRVLEPKLLQERMVSVTTELLKHYQTF
ncbi:YafY family transcriptional regulator [Brevibacillus ruminantium]|uniref:YafY family transcriptional regulator n=1 Tax=Brevibacillus ruminantium TaxID=2950604 RepID=A0ABY4WGH6_9BACL|nr:YafY family protein [Brevibacillus ruminantium]USG66187.1 YafY family transcriptional regulator [Brevibacillus ruminantium]